MKLSHQYLFALIGLMAPVFAFGATGLVIPAGGALTIPSLASLNLGCSDLSIQGNTTFGSAQIQNIGSLSIGSTGVLNAGSATIQVITSWTNRGKFVGGSSTVSFLDGCPPSQRSNAVSARGLNTHVANQANIFGDNVFNDLDLTSQSGRTYVMEAGHTTTVNGTFTMQGTPSNPVHITSSDPNGPPTSIVMGPGAQIVSSNTQIDPSMSVVHTNPIPSPTAIPTLDGTKTLIMIFLLMAMTMWFHSGKQTPIYPKQPRR